MDSISNTEPIVCHGAHELSKLNSSLNTGAGEVGTIIVLIHKKFKVGLSHQAQLDAGARKTPSKLSSSLPLSSAPLCAMASFPASIWRQDNFPSLPGPTERNNSSQQPIRALGTSWSWPAKVKCRAKGGGPPMSQD